MEITLEDVELAIRILEIFMDKYRRAERVLSRLGSYTSRSKSLEERIAEMVLANKQQNIAIPNIESVIDTDTTLSEEERQRIEELKKKYLSK